MEAEAERLPIFRISIELLIAVLVDVTVKAYIHSLVPLLPYGWMAVFVHSTWKLLTNENTRKRLEPFYAWSRKNGRMPYMTIAVFALGGIVFSAAWYALGKALGTPNLKETEPKREAKTPAHPDTPAEVSKIPQPVTIPATREGNRHVDLSLPIVVEFHVSNSRGAKEKFITIRNPGRVGIEDIQIEGIRYVFDKDSWKAHTLKLDFFSQLGVLARIPPIGLGKNSKPIDMGKIPIIKLYTFREALDAQEPALEAEPFRTYYCLRFTFRDERTKERYAFYKVTTAFYGSPSMIEEEGTAAGGGVGHVYLQDVPEVVKAAARDFYGNALKEYKP